MNTTSGGMRSSWRIIPPYFIPYGRVGERTGSSLGVFRMRRHRALVMLGAAITLIALAVPSAAFGVLENEYGMRYAGEKTCVVCHAVATYGQTTHADFAKRGAFPDHDYMWPAGRSTGGMTIGQDDVAFSLGGGTGLYEYLIYNPTYSVGPKPVAYTEIQGANRYDTAVAASKSAFTSAATVVVATGQAYPDALGGAGLAGAVNGPLLLTPTNGVPASVIAEIKRLGATKIYVLGGEAAVSKAAYNQLNAVAPATRLAGGNRYATGNAVAAEVVRVLGAGFSGKAIMATGANFPDALGCQSILYAKDMPLILVDPSGAYTLPAGVTSVKVVSTGAAVPASVDAALAGAFAAPRITGANAYATAAAVADYGVSLGMKYDGVGIVTGQAFPDALSAGPAIGAKNGVILLTTTAGLSPEAAAKLTANKATIAKASFMGGQAAVSLATRNQVKAILTGAAASADPNPFAVATFEWLAEEPEVWEIGPEGIATETYTCNGCHHLGFVSQGAKPLVGKFAASAVNGFANQWVSDPASSATDPADKLAAGASIQCENCHGTGEASEAVSNHYGPFTSNVKILKGTQLLDSQLCGQCHGAWEGGNMRGYTPDQNILTFGNPYDLADVPTEATWNGGKLPGTTTNWRFFPSGQNRSAKHSYYTEWAMSGHSYRGQYFDEATGQTENDPRVTPYQKEVGGHYAPDASFANINCTKCHTGEGYAKRKGLAIMKDFVPTTSNTGYMGIECANCHIAHGTDEDNNMGLRKPDSAPTLGGITMTSICEDCHNWQLEMEAKPVVTDPAPEGYYGTPARTVADFGGYIHPTREIYNGIGMFEVPDAGKFMTDVKCEECHMPATRSDFPAKTGIERYDDRSFKRYSHSMHIMEPGDAAAWGLPRWGDSCSPCHVGTPVEDLQEAIETWQADAAAASVEASAAYAAAWTIAEAPGAAETPDSAAFQTLMGRAYYNNRNYLGEGSGGAHNPEYITAGLEVATKMAKSVNGYFDFFTVGGAYPGVNYLMGNVKNGDGSNAASATIVITVGGVDTHVTTDANGNFSYLYSSASSLDGVYWQRCSDPNANVYVP